LFTLCRIVMKPHKHILIIGSLLMTVAVLAPSFIKLGHTLYEHHNEKKCIDYGTNHIHDGHLDCDFHDFTLVNKVLFTSSFNYTPVNTPDLTYVTAYYAYVYKPIKASFQSLRAPPVAT
jgi:hypothetical protein